LAMGENIWKKEGRNIILSGWQQRDIVGNAEWNTNCQVPLADWRAVINAVLI
jgi:hypothetical protein